MATNKKPTTTIGTIDAKINLTQAKEILHRLYAVEEQTGVRYTPMLLGAPGNGKTAIVEEFAKELDEMHRNAGKPGVICLPFRLSQCDPTDLKGVPTYIRIGDMNFCSYAPPGNFPIKGEPLSAGGMFVLMFLDELPQATPGIQNLGSNIIDGKVGDSEIDFNRCFVIVAGNRREDRAATYDTPNNVRNRVATLTISISFDEWETWAVSKKVNPFVIGYLKAHTEFFNTVPPDNGGSYATPRSWEKISADLNTNGETWLQSSVTLPLLIGTLGSAAAHDFYQSVITSKDKYRLADIIAGKKVEVPKDQATIYRMIYEGVYQLNSWVEAVIKEPEYLQAPGEKKSDVLLKFLSKKGKDGVDKIAGINNIYLWGSQPGIDKGFEVLLNKLQKNAVKHPLRALFKLPELAPAEKAWAAIHATLVALSTDVANGKY